MSTLEAIAREVGVSARTVSNVLSGRNKESWESTARRAEQIREVAARLGYQPNGAASAIRTGRFGCVSILLSEDKNRSALFRGLLEGACEVLEERDMHLAITRLGDAVLSREGFLPKFLRQRMCDGLLINYNADIPERLRQAAQGALPIVWLNSLQEADCVRPDDHDAGFQATRSLIELGHRRITYTTHSSTHYSAQARREGYEKAMKQARLKPQILRHPREGESWLQVSREILQEPNRPTALVNYSAHTAAPVLCAATLLGLEMPRDISIVTFGDHPFFDSTTCRTVGVWRTPEREVGRVAVEMLLGKIEEPGRHFEPRALPFAPDMAGSIGRAP